MESQLLANFLEDYSPKTDPLNFLVNSHLLDHKTWSPTCASVLLFYSSPSAALPRKCSVRITRYETREDDPERDHLGEQRTIEGPLYELIHESVTQTIRQNSSPEEVHESNHRTIRTGFQPKTS